MRELLESGSKEKEKGEDVLRDNGIRVWWTKCKRKKKKKRKRKRMDERKAINQKSQFKNITTIFLQ